jgi:hypothetical protein
MAKHSEVFDHCDVFLPRVGEPEVIDIFANEKAQKAVQALFPDLPIKWFSPQASGVGPVSPGWLWATLEIKKMAELSKGHKLAEEADPDPDASMNLWLRRLAVSLHRDGMRVIVHDSNRGYRRVEQWRPPTPKRRRRR